MKLSIITVNLNNAEGLRKTIESVVTQTFPDFEYIIIDGYSTDGSVEIIKQYADKITYWISEPDKGIYNAMNKGILQAKGEYCLFLNSGDWLLEINGLETVFQKIYKEDIIYCNIKTQLDEWIYPYHLSLFYFANKCIGHPSSFIKKILFHNIGLYDETFKITSDYDFFLNAIIKNSCSYKHLDYFLSFFDLTGISSTHEIQKEIEKTNVILKNFPDLFEDIEDFKNTYKELQFYKNSKLVQFLKKIQTNKLYKKIRNIK